MNPVIDALKFRHACKQFDPTQKIPRQKLDTILEAARLSPTSFGMEAWKLLVLASEDCQDPPPRRSHSLDQLVEFR